MIWRHTAAEASFTWLDLWNIRHWGRGMRSIVAHWLLVWAFYFRLPKFYLWDLLPSIYLSYPEIFDDNAVHLSSSVEDLETGMLVVSREGKGMRVNLPKRILDENRFRRVLFEAWRAVDARAVCAARLP